MVIFHSYVIDYQRVAIVTQACNLGKFHYDLNQRPKPIDDGYL